MIIQIDGGMLSISVSSWIMSAGDRPTSRSTSRKWSTTSPEQVRVGPEQVILVLL